jgi:cullin-4
MIFHAMNIFWSALGEIITKRDKASLKKLDETLIRVTASSETWNVSPSDSLLDHYRNEIFRRVKEIVTDTAEDARMIERLLELKEFLDDCLSPACLNDIELHDRKFTYATSEAFERGFMCRKIKPAELIGVFFFVNRDFDLSKVSQPNILTN